MRSGYDPGLSSHPSRGREQGSKLSKKTIPVPTPPPVTTTMPVPKVCCCDREKYVLIICARFFLIQFRLLQTLLTDRPLHQNQLDLSTFPKCQSIYKAPTPDDQPVATTIPVPNPSPITTTTLLPEVCYCDQKECVLIICACFFIQFRHSPNYPH
jgi:hypothetical protein